MQYMSPNVETLTGYPPASFVGNQCLSYADIVHVDDRERISQEIDHALNTGRGFALTYRIRSADGQVKFVQEYGNAIRDPKGNIVALQGFVTDLTHVQAMQQELDEVTERFKWIAHVTNDNLWDWNLKTNELWHGKSDRQIFDLPANETNTGLGTWSSLIHPDDAERVVASIHAAADGAGDEWSCKYRLRRMDGSYADVIDRAAIIRDRNKVATRMVGGVSDLTERQQSQLYLDRMNRALLVLSHCNERLIRATDEQHLLNDICQVIVETGGYKAAAVEFLEATMPLRGEMKVCNDIATDSSVIAQREELLGRGYRSGIWLPVAHNGRRLGVIAIYHHSVAPFDAEEIQLLQTLANNLAFGIANLRSTEHHKRIESAAVKIAAGVSGNTGKAFFSQFARNMALAVGADGAFVARFDKDELDVVETVIAVIDGVEVPNFAYEIAGSPCEKLLASSGCLVLDEVTTCFPGSGAARMGMQGYAGCKLDSVAGRPLGVLFVLFRGPVPQPDFVMQTLRIFAARAGAELERQLSDARILEQASLLDKAKDAIVVHDASGRVTFWNKSAERLYGLTAETVLGTFVDEVLYDDADQYQAMCASLHEKGQWQGEIIHGSMDGHELVAEVSSTLVKDSSNRSSSVLSIITDITRRKTAEYEVAKLAFQDRLTGLPNRHFLEQQLQGFLDRRAGAGDEGALLWIDLDHLKTLNDTRGHDMGDLLLKCMSARIQASIGRADVAARFGGDEFVVLITELGSDRDNAIDVARRLLQRLNEPVELAGQTHSSSASIGLAYFRADRDAATEILKRADIAMYEAKAAGRNTLRLFDMHMQKRVDLRAELENDLRHALQQGRLHLAYQPQIADTGQVIGVEALLRWNHPVRGPVSPADFIPVAEATGLIIPCGEWVLTQACEQLRRWQDDPLRRSLSIAVNVSARQIRHPGFVEQVMTILDRSGADPHKLKLELTESSLVTDTEATVDKMKALKAIGISFSLDDFGTGFSSLSYLNRLPLDQLKIDRSFVTDVVDDANAAVITRTVIALGQSLSLEVIAEGVETESQRRFLAAHGCTIYQGYLFSRPVDIDQLEDYLRRRDGADAPGLDAA
jgi:diguanylate cyclase (GGDEF)-like protein/PAS domain S-box-containing protein